VGSFCLKIVAHSIELKRTTCVAEVQLLAVMVFRRIKTSFDKHRISS